MKQGPAALTNNKQENVDQIQAAIDFLFFVLIKQFSFKIHVSVLAESIKIIRQFL